MQSGKARVQSKTTPKFRLVNKPSQLSPHKVFSFTVYHLLVNNNRGRAGELKREGRLIEGIRYIKKITYSLNMQLVYQKRHRFA